MEHVIFITFRRKSLRLLARLTKHSPLLFIVRVTIKRRFPVLLIIWLKTSGKIISTLRLQSTVFPIPRSSHGRIQLGEIRADR